MLLSLQDRVQWPSPFGRSSQHSLPLCGPDPAMRLMALRSQAVSCPRKPVRPGWRHSGPKNGPPTLRSRPPTWFPDPRAWAKWDLCSEPEQCASLRTTGTASASPLHHCCWIRCNADVAPQGGTRDHSPTDGVRLCGWWKHPRNDLLLLFECFF